MVETINPSILVHLQISPHFRAEVEHYFPELTEVIASYIQNNNCECKKTILHSLWGHRNSVDFSKAMISGPTPIIIQDLPEVPVEEISTSINKREMFGEMVCIPASREAYRKIIQRAKNEEWVFHGFTITETKHKWKLFFY